MPPGRVCQAQTVHHVPATNSFKTSAYQITVFIPDILIRKGKGKRFLAHPFHRWEHQDPK